MIIGNSRVIFSIDLYNTRLHLYIFYDYLLYFFIHLSFIPRLVLQIKNRFKLNVI